MIDSPQNLSGSRKGLIIVAGIAALFLCTCMALAGFAIGRASATSQTITETLSELVEVTREVTREVQVPAAVNEVTPNAPPGDGAAEEAAPGELDDFPDFPTPAPTVPPATADFVEGNVEDLDFALFDEVWQVIAREFDGPVPPTDSIIYSAIEGSLGPLNDEYTRFIRPDTAAVLREDLDGAVEGIGALVREDEQGYIEISSPIAGQPAERAGLLPGDLIVAVNGESVVGQSLEEVVVKVRGPAGTDVTLTILRRGADEPLEFTITRARFEVPVVESEMLPENIAYARLAEFSSIAHGRLLAALEELLAQEPRGLIIDLRANPGGLLTQAVAVSDLFLSEGIILIERNNRGEEEIFRAGGGQIAESIPLVVLVNQGSASGAEIVAGALQDNGRAVLIGSTTFGKGSVQTVNELSDGSELRVTIARWYTPANHSIDGAGIAPDIEVPIDPDSPEDAQLQRAIEYLLEN